MALGKVSVNNLNLGQGAVSEIERYFYLSVPLPRTSASWSRWTPKVIWTSSWALRTAT